MSLNHSTPQPAPTPLCFIYKPQLALLALGKLDKQEAAEVRTHVDGCEYCQMQLRQYEIVREAVARHYGAATPGRQAESPSSARRRTTVTAPPLTLEYIMKADQEETDTATANREPPTPLRQLSPRQRTLSALGAIAAVLVLAVLAASLFSYFGARGMGPAVKPTPTRGIDAQSQAYLNVLQTYYPPAADAFVTIAACRANAGSASRWMQNCQSLASPVVATAQALKGHLTLTPPTRWQASDTQIKQATDDTITGFSAAASATTVSDWSTAESNAELAFAEYCAPIHQINGDLVQAGIPLSDLLNDPGTGLCGG